MPQEKDPNFRPGPGSPAQKIAALRAAVEEKGPAWNQVRMFVRDSLAALGADSRDSAVKAFGGDGRSSVAAWMSSGGYSVGERWGEHHTGLRNGLVGGLSQSDLSNDEMLRLGEATVLALTAKFGGPEFVASSAGETPGPQKSVRR